MPLLAIENDVEYNNGLNKIINYFSKALKSYLTYLVPNLIKYSSLLTFILK